MSQAAADSVDTLNRGTAPAEFQQTESVAQKTLLAAHPGAEEPAGAPHGPAAAPSSEECAPQGPAAAGDSVCAAGADDGGAANAGGQHEGAGGRGFDGCRSERD
jgi:rare lipoprotein A (peptidoglycan hydrolase)